MSSVGTIAALTSGEGSPMAISVEARLEQLESKIAEAEARLEHLSVVPEIVLLVHECIIDIADTVEELAGQAPEGHNGRLERLEQLTNRLIL